MRLLIIFIFFLYIVSGKYISYSNYISCEITSNGTDVLRFSKEGLLCKTFDYKKGKYIIRFFKKNKLDNDKINALQEYIYKYKFLMIPKKKLECKSQMIGKLQYYSILFNKGDSISFYSVRACYSDTINNLIKRMNDLIPKKYINKFSLDYPRGCDGCDCGKKIDFKQFLNVTKEE